jgi:hypothetical protein
MQEIIMIVFLNQIKKRNVHGIMNGTDKLLVYDKNRFELSTIILLNLSDLS